MKRKKVESSNIVSVGYDESESVLELEFKNGVYHYPDVPKDVYKGLLKAKSVGKYFHAEIKNNFDGKRGEFKKMTIPNIYICGKAGSGKTFAAKYLIEKCGYQRAKFAGPVYGIAHNYFGMGHNEKDKDRKLLQTIGTDAGRDSLDEDIWVKRFVQDIQIVQITRKLLNKTDIGFVCDDCRFRNEHKVLQDSGWVGLFLNAPDELREERLGKRDGNAQASTLTHVSEVNVDSFKDELIQIDSSGTLEDTYNQLDKLLNSFKG